VDSTFRRLLVVITAQRTEHYTKASVGEEDNVRRGECIACVLRVILE